MIMVVTSANDRTADRVVADLEQRGEAVTRFDVADFPERVAISAELGDDKRGWRGWLQTENSRIGWDEVKSIYYRRPTSFVFPDGVIGSDLAFATAEARRGFGGLLFSLPVRWVNHPSPKEAEFKPMQLDVALSCGLTTPRTLLTSDPDEARLFCETAKNGAIYKPLSAANIVTGDEVQLVFTTRVSSGDFDDADVSRTANLFQEWVPKLTTYG